MPRAIRNPIYKDKDACTNDQYIHKGKEGSGRGEWEGRGEKDDKLAKTRRVKEQGMVTFMKTRNNKMVYILLLNGSNH